MLLSLGRSVKKNQFLFLNKNYSYKHLRFKLGQNSRAMLRFFPRDKIITKIS